jgi:hypothetical protein
VKRRGRTATPAPPPPRVPDLAVAPELAAILLLEHALDVATDALLAEHMTLIDDFHPPREQGPVVHLAEVICRRAAALRETLWRYRHAVRDAAAPPPHEPPDDNSF